MRNHYLAAAREGWNISLLCGATALSLAWLTPLPLIAALGCETIYLVLLPRSRWYDERLARRFAMKRRRQRQILRLRILPRVRPAMRTRYSRLETLRAGFDSQIAQHYPRWVDEMSWLRELRGRLDTLLEKFLHFALREAQFRADLEATLQHICETGYGPGVGRAAIETLPAGWRQLDARGRGLAGVLPPAPPFSTPAYPDSLATTLARRILEQPIIGAGDMAVPLQRHRDDLWVQQLVREILAGYAREMADLTRLRERETNTDTIAVLETRIDVLSKRRVQTEEVGYILTNLHHQLRLVEDTFRLISSELNSRPPEQILADVEDVIDQSEGMMRVLKEILPYESLP